MRIYKRGKNWHLDFVYKGEWIRKAAGTNKKMAGAALKEVELKITKEEFPGIYAQKRVLFENFAKPYLEYSRVNKAPGLYARDKTNINNLFPEFKGILLSEITTEEIEHNTRQGERSKCLTPLSIGS